MDLNLNPNKYRKNNNEEKIHIFVDDNDAWLGVTVGEPVRVNGKDYNLVLPLEQNIENDIFAINKNTVPVVKETSNNCINTINVHPDVHNDNKDDYIEKKWTDQSGVTTKFILDKKRKFSSVLPRYTQFNFFKNEKKYSDTYYLITNIHNFILREFDVPCSSYWLYLNNEDIFQKCLKHIINNTDPKLLVIDDYTNLEQIVHNSDFFLNLDANLSTDKQRLTLVNIAVDSKFSKNELEIIIRDFITNLAQVISLKQKITFLLSFSYIDTELIPITLINFIDNKFSSYGYEFLNKNITPLSSLRLNTNKYTTLFYSLNHL